MRCDVTVPSARASRAGTRAVSASPSTVSVAHAVDDGSARRRLAPTPGSSAIERTRRRLSTSRLRPAPRPHDTGGTSPRASLRAGASEPSGTSSSTMSVPSSSATKVTGRRESTGVSGDDGVPRPSGPTPMTPGIAAPAPSAASMLVETRHHAADRASRPSRSRQPRTASRSSSVASTSGSRRPPTSWPSRFSAHLIAIGFDDDAEQVDRGPKLLVERAGALDVARAEAPHHLPHLRPDDVRVHAHAAACRRPRGTGRRGRRRLRRGRDRARRSRAPARGRGSPASPPAPSGSRRAARSRPSRG